VFCSINSTREWPQLEDLALGQIQFENGVLANMIASTAIFPEQAASVHIHGSLGTASLIENRGRTHSFK
jgi:hypothetical protein